ncbi:pre-mRNA-splicing factor 38A, putative [Plasmodium knowlesi strain H]|uniref:Pre-mRNA-splicing factor 38 n=3 Tax=Plasmodium knowlesi TaxID=5850 RepID=A0A5K1VU53_PLAKH|nr:pre-mRNA-splicing factor 38A, putative [Plasmodium knowlesi strain H]OTN65202.1 putative Pre-mRNA-splicing factor 38A [Plasmodium knowlesi]CAA9988352.1 pre-mRNA-splicing factor 38A, putative [Plasmodium knowlesi strain H]SBO20071.1 pre-mRNA-splicing factor 38A, putative [Plasmodium knowlesi strain H]SBO20308.1 pre-mRNA-splicing factor 38A, putative [Plasmodium knowlesi strain H]VVS77826.1 pre-mRNA-splicing factor 38A, putative [Plasmodium knowlesi strain H]|eukprot:XP_002259332.1 splicing component, putative [Plasmodium knowlesi strain H]
MANRTDISAIKIFGSNPQYLISNIIRSKIYESPYWKEKCFALTSESIIDQAVNLKYVGGTYGGNRKPTRFLCLVLKLLQIQPDKDIIYEYIKNEEFIYLRALGIFYLRLIGKSLEIYRYLEPILFDYRKMRIRLQNGTFEKIYMDVFVDNCLVMNNFLDVDFPSLTKRQVLEDNNLLEKVNLDYYKELLNISSGNELFENQAKERGDDPPGGGYEKWGKNRGGNSTPSSGYGSGGGGHVERIKRKERYGYWERGRQRRRDRESRDRDTDTDRSYSRDQDREKRKRGENKRTEHRRHKKKRHSAEGRKNYSTSESPETRRRERKRRYEREDSDKEKIKKKERRKRERRDKERQEKERKKKQKQEKERKKKGDSDVEENKKDDALSVERWNKIRKELGLNPLQ